MENIFVCVISGNCVFFFSLAAYIKPKLRKTFGKSKINCIPKGYLAVKNIDIFAFFAPKVCLKTSNL